MQVADLNKVLREMFLDLMKNGAVKRQLAMFTLGANNVVQFDKFLNGQDLGIKPLSRMIEAFGYKLHLVPLPENENHRTEELENITREFLNSCSFALASSIEEYEKTKSERLSGRRRNPTVRNAIDGFVNELLENM